MKPGLEVDHAGAELELKVAQEAEVLGHAVLIENPFNPHIHGFDLVSFHPRKGELHIWEAKDYKKSTVSKENLGTILNALGKPSPKQSRDIGSNKAREHAKQRAGKLFGSEAFEGTKGVLGTMPSNAARGRIVEAIREGKVFFHLRGSAPTKYSKDVKNMFSQKNFDYKNYE